MDLRSARVLLAVLGVPAFLAGSFVVLLLLGFAAENDHGITPADSPLTPVVVLWAIGCLLALVIGVLGARAADRVRRLLASTAIAVGVWLGASVIAFWVLAR